MKQQARKVARELSNYLFDYCGELAPGDYDVLTRAQKVLIKIINAKQLKH